MAAWCCKTVSSPKCWPLAKHPHSPAHKAFDAREHVVLPGLINTHHHFYQTLTRAWAPVVNQPLFPWLKTLYPVWARLTPEKLALATKVALAELLLSGCTTAADHHYLFPDGLENAIDVQVESVRELGMRAMLTRGSMSLGEADGGLPPQQTVQQGQVILDDSQRLIRAVPRARRRRADPDRPGAVLAVLRHPRNHARQRRTG